MSDIVSGDLRTRHRSMATRGTEGRPLPQERSPLTRPAPRKVANYSKQSLQSVGTLAFSIAVAVLLLIGWQNRHENYLTAEEGLGYYLGISGAVMMLVLLLYPLRKKLRLLGRLGKVSHWFRMHMLLGIVGPVLILFHANFQLGSANSSVALISMLTVALSGLAGRFIYTRIHMGLYGKKARLAEILADTDALKRTIGADVNDFASIERDLQNFEHRFLVPYRGLLVGALSAMLFGLRTYLCRRSILRRARATVRAQAQTWAWSRNEQRARLRAVEIHLSEYFAAARKSAHFAFYERLFSVWHVLHLPMFFFLISATIVHIVAVHLY